MLKMILRVHSFVVRKLEAVKVEKNKKISIELDTPHSESNLPQLGCVVVVAFEQQFFSSHSPISRKRIKIFIQFKSVSTQIK